METNNHKEKVLQLWQQLAAVYNSMTNNFKAALFIGHT
jgi:hypothetical protein